MKIILDLLTIRRLSSQNSVSQKTEFHRQKKTAVNQTIITEKNFKKLKS